LKTLGFPRSFKGLQRQSVFLKTEINFYLLVKIPFVGIRKKRSHSLYYHRNIRLTQHMKQKECESATFRRNRELFQPSPTHKMRKIIMISPFHQRGKLNSKFSR
jgi:hypothetical protein